MNWRHHGILIQGCSEQDGEESNNYRRWQAIRLKISKGKQIVKSGGTANKTTIQSGGIQIVSGGAYASNTQIKAGGSQVLSGGKKGTVGFGIGTVVSSGGKMIVYGTGLATADKILSGGSLTIKSGGVASSLTMTSGAKLSMTGGASALGTVNLKGATLSLSGENNLIESATTNKNTKYTFNLKAITSSGPQQSQSPRTTSLYFQNQTKLNGKITLLIDDHNRGGNYLFAHNATIADKTNITLKIGNKTLTVPYYSKYDNVSYKWCDGHSFVVHGQNNGYLTVSISGTWHTRNHKFKTLTKESDGYYHYSGTTGNDLIYAAGNTKYNDKIYLLSGKDIVAYDTTKWGKDIIQKTDGTCAILFKDLTSKDVTEKLSGSTMTITKKSDTKQTITVQGWSDKTHTIVFGGKLSALDKYINATNPNNGICTSAYNEAFKKVGLADCTVRQS
ncbi:MAG: hypothetical protein IJU76_14665 [Desulfovibrionaceae bacterium]|nr:hypothetical protein [Desulfovibrionaceae bacterium]